MEDEKEDKALVDRLVDVMERAIGALESINDTLEELNTNIGTLIDVEMRKGDEKADI